MRIAWQPEYSGLYVVETVDGRAYVGRIQQVRGQVFIYTGFRGHPPVVDVADIDEVTPIEEHAGIQVCA